MEKQLVKKMINRFSFSISTLFGVTNPFFFKWNFSLKFFYENFNFLIMKIICC
jgi:hypothetical protein